MSYRTFCEEFGLKLPIIQAPMAGVQGSALAIAVANAGGLGSLPCANLSAETLRQELASIRAHSANPFNLNFFCHTTPDFDAARDTAWRELLLPYYREYGLDPAALAPAPARAPFTAATADLIEESRPPVVSFHFGLPPQELLERVKGWGSKVLGCATTVDEARYLEERGVHAIIAQGLEAGGHRGIFLSEDLDTQVATFALVRQIVAACRVPVIAAGGIADAAGVASALALGASAVQVGTAYLLCPEATTSLVHRAALRRPNVTALTNLFSGRPARGIVNRLMHDLGAINGAAPAFPLAATALAPLRAAAEKAGKGDFSPLWSGQNPSGCREIGAAVMTRELAASLPVLGSP